MIENRSNLALEYLIGKSGRSKLANLKILLLLDPAEREIEESLKTQLTCLNIKRIAYKNEISKQEFKFLQSYDFIVDCSLDMSQSIALNDACRKQNKNYIKASLYNVAFFIFTDFGSSFTSTIRAKNSLITANINSIKKQKMKIG